MLSVCLGLHEWPWAFLNPYSAENESLLDWCSLTLLIRYSSDWTFSFLKRSLCSWEAFASFCIRSKLRVFLASCSCSLVKLWVVSTAKKVDCDSWNFCIIHSNTCQFSLDWWAAHIHPKGFVCSSGDQRLADPLNTVGMTKNSHTEITICLQ